MTPFEKPLPPVPVLTTERLVLRPPKMEDVPAIQRDFPDWEVVKHLHGGIPWPYPPDGAATNMAECLARLERREFCCWTITLRGGDDECIGRIDLKPDVANHDMRGFWLARAHWGRGLMTEAAEAVTGFAFEVLEWPFLYLNNAVENVRSHRIKEKQGATLVATYPRTFMAGELMREVWLLKAEDWLAARGRA